MKMPHFLRNWLWEKEMRKLIKAAKTPAIDNSFRPKRCILLYPADDAAWEQLVHKQTSLWPAVAFDFAYIGYNVASASDTPTQPPFHRFDDSMLGLAYNLPANWLAHWSKSADLLLVANPTQLPALDLLAAQLPAFFKVSVFATEFGELYSFVLQSGPDKPEERLQTLHAYLQKIIQL